MSPSEDISPPPLKRRRLSPSLPPTPESPSPTPSTIISPHARPSTAAQIHLSIYSWNINGIAPFLPPQTTKITSFLTTSSPPKSAPKQPSLRARLRHWKWPHILTLQEVKIAPSNIKTQSAVPRIINASLDSEDEDDESRYLYDTHFCLPRDKHNATGFGGKVYGVCTFIRRDIKDVRVKAVNWDPEGRVLLAELQSLGVVVMNIYAVNGTTNDYRDPQTGKVVGTRHDRKRTFHTLLANEVASYQDKGWSVIVAGDFNISRARIDSFPQLRMGEDHVKNRADFEEKIVRGLGMIDTFRMLHGEERKFTYRPRNKPWGAGGDRVDMVLVSKGLKEAVREADMLDYEVERGPSDHVPLFIEVMVGKGSDGKEHDVLQHPLHEEWDG